MNAKRFNYLMMGVLALLVVTGGAVAYFSNQYLQTKAANVASIKAELAGVEAKESTFVRSRNELKQHEELKASIDRILPQDKDQARAIRELFAIAEESGIRITNITFPTSELGRKTQTAKPQTTTEGAQPQTQSQATNAVTQAKPVEGISGVLGISASVGFDKAAPNQPITFERFQQFLQKLELNRRTMQVSQVTITPTNQGEGEFDFSVNLTIFVKP